MQECTKGKSIGGILLFPRNKTLPDPTVEVVIVGKLSRLTRIGEPPPIGFDIFTGICRKSSSALSYL